jgi:hypothetical protein
MITALLILLRVASMLLRHAARERGYRAWRGRGDRRACWRRGIAANGPFCCLRPRRLVGSMGCGGANSESHFRTESGQKVVEGIPPMGPKN